MDFPLTAYVGAALGLVPGGGGAKAALEDTEISPALQENAYELLNVLAGVLNECSDVHQRLHHVHRPGERRPGGRRALDHRTRSPHRPGPGGQGLRQGALSISRRSAPETGRSLRLGRSKAGVTGRTGASRSGRSNGGRPADRTAGGRRGAPRRRRARRRPGPRGVRPGREAASSQGKASATAAAPPRAARRRAGAREQVPGDQAPVLLGQVRDDGPPSPPPRAAPNGDGSRRQPGRAQSTRPGTSTTGSPRPPRNRSRLGQRTVPGAGAEGRERADAGQVRAHRQPVRRVRRHRAAAPPTGPTRPPRCAPPPDVRPGGAWRGRGRRTGRRCTGRAPVAWPALAAGCCAPPRRPGRVRRRDPRRVASRALAAARASSTWLRGARSSRPGQPLEVDGAAATAHRSLALRGREQHEHRGSLAGRVRAHDAAASRG